MSILSRLFGKGKGEAAAAEPEEHKGFLIFPDPYSDAGGYRVAARIEKEIGGPKGLEPTRYGDWEKAGRCVDF